MSGRRKPLVGVWRDAVRDSELDRVAKLVAHTLSTYFNGHGIGYPSRRELAKGSSLGKGRRSVDGAITRLEGSGFLEIERSRGRSSHRYRATLPATASELRHAEWATAHAMRRSDEDQRRSGVQPTAHIGASNSARRAPESVESAESAALDAARALEGGAAGAVIEDICGHCEERLPLVDDVYCAACRELVAAGRAARRAKRGATERRP